MQEPLTRSYTLCYDKFISLNKTTEWYYSAYCTMNVNPTPSATEDNVSLAGFVIDNHWGYDNHNLVNWSFHSTNDVNSIINNIPLTYADIYKLTKYLFTKFNYPVEKLAGANDFIEFKEPNKSKSEYRWTINFRIWTGETDHKMMLIQANPPKQGYEPQHFSCLVKKQDDIRDFIAYLTGCLFGLWNKDNKRDGIEAIKSDALACLINMGFYTKEEIDQIEDHSFDT